MTRYQRTSVLSGVEHPQKEDRWGSNAVAACGAILCIAGLGLAPVGAGAQTQRVVTCPAPQQSLIAVPEIRSGADHKLKATLKLVDGVRTLWGDPGDTRCATQNLRFLQGYQGYDSTKAPAWPAGPEPIPGPTFRARIGDLVEIAFFNQIDLNNFASTLDRGDVGTSQACDQYTTSTSTTASTTKVPGNDTMPNCLHGSSTTNVHFHGTHTTPSTTGDNVLLFVRPSLRTAGGLLPSEADANAAFAKVFADCEQKGPPKLWTDLPPEWQALQKSLLQQYDQTAPYQGQAGTLPVSMQIWPANQSAIDQGLWPQYQLGANPYCFPLPAYDPAKMKMGQSPGTHWYHAHKHGSTALNVANGLTGAFIIEGQYDDDLHKYYPKLREQVMMIQQLSTAPFALTNPGAAPKPGAPRPPLSINGRINPVVAMLPGEVQQWRIVNGAFRDAVQFSYFEPQQKTPCAQPQAKAAYNPQWRQIAQDGVQFNLWNYQNVGKVNAPLLFAAANRADLLVKAPTQAGNYTLCVSLNASVFVQAGAPGGPEAPSPLLTVNVSGKAINPPMEFIPDAQFPTFPPFLTDITDAEVQNYPKRQLTFGAGFNTINGVKFQDHHVDQSMVLNTAEEWTLFNQANDKAHPFHIHINPFQVIEVFQPNSPEATTPGNPCYVDPNNPATFKPCPSQQPAAPWVWWDVFPIPTAQQITLTSCSVKENCPKELQPYITGCTAATSTTPGSCTETIPGWFKMRSRFVDFTGQYVLHCHILIHEDRGMMQLIQVVPDTSPYSHH